MDSMDCSHLRPRGLSFWYCTARDLSSRNSTAQGKAQWIVTTSHESTERCHPQRDAGCDLLCSTEDAGNRTYRHGSVPLPLLLFSKAANLN